MEVELLNDTLPLQPDQNYKVVPSYIDIQGFFFTRVNAMKILARFFYLSAFLLLPLTGVILAGFFFSRQWLEDLTAAADVATMNSATLKLSMRSSLFYPFAPSAFADYDSSALCPKYSSPCSPALAKLLPGHTVFLTGSCAFDWYPDPALSCCPGGYRCFLGGPVAELEMPICGLLQEGSNVSLQVSPAQVFKLL